MCLGSNDMMKVSGNERQHFSELTKGGFLGFWMNVDEMFDE